MDSDADARRMEELQQAFGESSGDEDDDAATETRRREALQQAFGESSGDEDADAAAAFLLVSEQEFLKPRWESVEGIKGLWICREFLSGDQQSALLSAIEREGWFAESSHNQAMRFGDLPGWSTEVARLVRDSVRFGEISFKGSKILIAAQQFTEDLCPLPSDLLWREPLFDQLIVNVYKAGEGICAHVDLMRFEDGIAIISMESTCVMHFSQPEASEEDSCRRIPVFLNPGSLVLMSGEARYLWKHEINRKPGFQLWEGKEIHQQRRTSVTLRKLCPSPDQN